MHKQWYNQGPGVWARRALGGPLCWDEKSKDSLPSKRSSSSVNCKLQDWISVKVFKLLQGALFGAAMGQTTPSPLVFRDVNHFLPCFLLFKKTCFYKNIWHQDFVKWESALWFVLCCGLVFNCNQPDFCDCTGMSVATWKWHTELSSNLIKIAV